MTKLSSPTAIITASCMEGGKGETSRKMSWKKCTFPCLYGWNTFAFSSSDTPNDEMIKPVISRDNQRLGASTFKQHSNFPFYPWSPSYADVGWLADVFGLRGSLKQLWFPQQLVVCRDRKKSREALLRKVSHDRLHSESITFLCEICS